MGCVVGNDAVQCSVQHGFQNGLTVFFGTKRRIDSSHGALFEDFLLGIDEILGAGLCGDRDAVGLSLSDQRCGAFGGDVGDMDVGAGFGWPAHQIPCHH